MNEGTTSSSDPDASPTTETGQPTETIPDADSDHEGGDDTSVMARALKHELEDKGMTVAIEDDGETVAAEKLDQSYRIRPDGTVEGNGVLKDGIEDIVADLDPVEDSEVEQPAVDAESGTGDDSAGSASSTVETHTTEASSESVTDEKDEDEKNEVSTPTADEVATPDSGTPTDPAETESTPAGVEDDSAADAEEEEAEEEKEEEAESLPRGTVGQFEASIEVGHLQEVIDAAQAVVDECRVHLDTDGAVIRAVDPANVAMVDESVSTDAFEAYETDCGEIGINLERLDEVVGIADNDDDLVQFELDAPSRKLDMQVNAVEYTLALIDPEAIRAEPEIPDLDLPASFAVEQSAFKRAIRAADMVSDHIQLRVDEHEECFIAEADGDTDDVELELPADDLEEADLNAADSLFSLDYLKDLRKPIPKDTTVHLQLGEEFPVILEFEMADGGVDVEYVLAPRIQSH